MCVNHSPFLTSYRRISCSWKKLNVTKTLWSAIVLICDRSLLRQCCCTRLPKKKSPILKEPQKNFWHWHVYCTKEPASGIGWGRFTVLSWLLCDSSPFSVHFVIYSMSYCHQGWALTVPVCKMWFEKCHRLCKAACSLGTGCGNSHCSFFLVFCHFGGGEWRLMVIRCM